MSTLGGRPRFPPDDGSADPLVTGALAAFAACAGSERAALAALARARLLVPVVAVPAAQAPEDGASGEQAAEMALPKLIGRDGRPAIPAFTSLDALHRWRPGARPVPVGTPAVCRAAADESCAVMIDVAGPVPLAIEGARLAALARGADVPPPHDDPDIRAAVAAAVAERAPSASFRLLPAGPTGGEAADTAADTATDTATDTGAGTAADLIVELALPPGLAGAQAAELAVAVAAAAMDRLAGRLRRGIAVALVAGS